MSPTWPHRPLIPAPRRRRRYQYHFTYFDGLGREIQHKALAAPGPVTDGGPPVSPRWAGSGWTIFDNKGRPVRKYEPFFSATSGFEFAAQTGVSTVAVLRPAGPRRRRRCIPTTAGRRPSSARGSSSAGTCNDTVLIADPRADADVGSYFQRLLGTGPFTSWYQLRAPADYGTTAQDQAAQQDAAEKAAAHAATPAVTTATRLGRACLAVADNGGGARYPVRTALRHPGRPLAVIDALGRRTEEYVYREPQPGGGLAYLAGSDMAGHPLYRINADGGARRACRTSRGSRSAAGTRAATRSASATTRPGARRTGT